MTEQIPFIDKTINICFTANEKVPRWNEMSGSKNGLNMRNL